MYDTPQDEFGFEMACEERELKDEGGGMWIG
jgi:hypothetical protein